MGGVHVTGWVWNAEDHVHGGFPHSASFKIQPMYIQYCTNPNPLCCCRSVIPYPTLTINQNPRVSPVSLILKVQSRPSGGVFPRAMSPGVVHINVPSPHHHERTHVSKSPGLIRRSWELHRHIPSICFATIPGNVMGEMLDECLLSEW